MRNWRTVAKLVASVVLLVLAAVMIYFGLIAGIIGTTGTIKVFDEFLGPGSAGAPLQEDEKLMLGILAFMLFFTGGGGFIIFGLGVLILVALLVWGVFELFRYRRRNLVV